MSKRIWSNARKWPGNLIPMLFLFAPVAYGTYLLTATFRPNPVGYNWIAAGFIGAWMSLCCFGLWGNRKLRKRIAVKLNQKERPDAIFVGFSRPGFRSALDPHEDLGFLVVSPIRLEFFGEDTHVSLDRTDVKRVRFRPNIHTWVGLGGWTSIEGEVEGKPVRMMVELRTSGILLVNFVRSFKLRQRLNSWLTEGKF